MTKIANNLSLVIIKRFMSDKELEAFADKYEEVKFHRSFGIRTATANDKRIHAHFLKVQSVSKAAADLGISTSKVYGAIARVSAAKK